MRCDTYKKKRGFPKHLDYFSKEVQDEYIEGGKKG
jgi:hypothetical protein